MPVVFSIVSATPSVEPRGSPEAEDLATLEDGTSADGTWIELAVSADIEAVEAVSEILARAAPGGVSVEPAFELVDEGLAARTDLSAPAVIRAYLPGLDRGQARRAIAQARVALGHLQAFGLRPIGDLETRVVHESDWANAWKRHFPVLRLGRRLVIRPTWRRHRAKEGEVVLALDPGMAFGTGLHPTTRLCLEAIERWADDGQIRKESRVLDVGCGSGILAIAAGRFGAGHLVALDVDLIAVEATETNARRNGLPHLRTRRGSVPSREAPFDLVFANLIASLLVSMADALAAEVKPGGRLLASGIFVDREPEVRAAFDSDGLEMAGRWSEGDWVALELRRPTIRRMSRDGPTGTATGRHGD
jgi:ribosomal protein L11 methyltransferase